MENAIYLILLIHIIIGGLALITGAMALGTKKGKKAHNKAGLIYFWSMMVVCISGIILSGYKLNWFLFSISIFTFYLAYSGYRIIKRKKMQLSILDIVITSIVLLVSLLMLYIGTKNIFIGNTMGWVLALFGGICFLGCVSDFLKSKRKSKYNAPWLLEHIGKMTGAYIGTFTAFIVNNVRFLPDLVTWVLPTIIGAIFIIITTKRYKQQLLKK